MSAPAPLPEWIQGSEANRERRNRLAKVQTVLGWLDEMLGEAHDLTDPDDLEAIATAAEAWTDEVWAGIARAAKVRPLSAVSRQMVADTYKVRAEGATAKQDPAYDPFDGIGTRAP